MFLRRENFHRRRLQIQVAPLGPVGLGDDGRDVAGRRLEQRGQAGAGQFSVAEKDDSQRRHGQQAKGKETKGEEKIQPSAEPEAGCGVSPAGSTQQTAPAGRRTRQRGGPSLDGRAGDCPFGERAAAAGAKEFVKFTGGQDEEQFLAHRLGTAAFGAIQFAGGEGSELLRHDGSEIFAMTRRMSRNTLMGVWVASIWCTNSGP